MCLRTAFLRSCSPSKRLQAAARCSSAAACCCDSDWRHAKPTDRSEDLARTHAPMHPVDLARTHGAALTHWAALTHGAALRQRHGCRQRIGPGKQGRRACCTLGKQGHASGSRLEAMQGTPCLVSISCLIPAGSRPWGRACCWCSVAPIVTRPWGRARGEARHGIREQARHP